MTELNNECSQKLCQVRARAAPGTMSACQRPRSASRGGRADGSRCAPPPASEWFGCRRTPFSWTWSPTWRRGVPLTPLRARRGSGVAGEKSWQVTAVDFSATALDFGRARAQAAGAEVAARLEWVDGDLGRWVPPAQAFDLVVSLYVHLDGDVGEALGRVARGVAPGGRFVLVGHQPRTPGSPRPPRGNARCPSPTLMRRSTPPSGASTSRRSGAGPTRRQGSTRSSS